MTLDAAALKALACGRPEHCRCALKACQGWDSVLPSHWPAEHLQAVGTLRQPLAEGQTEPTFEEFHPGGTRYASAQAPIALGFFPFNRCDVHRCTRCGCAVLCYTEYGGYYVDQRVRLVDADLVVEPPPGPAVP